MGLIQRLLGQPAAPDLPAEVRERLEAWQQGQGVAPSQPGRYVLLDIATDGLDPTQHMVQALAALGMRQGVVSAADVVLIESLSEVARRGDFQLQHALLDVLEHIGSDPLVTWQSGFVGPFLQVLYREQLGVDWAPSWLDLAILLPELFPDSPVAGKASFDAWLAVFGIEIPGRLAALPDTIGMARLLQLALAEAARRGLDVPRQWHEIERSRRWLGK